MELSVRTKNIRCIEYLRTLLIVHSEFIPEFLSRGFKSSIDCLLFGNVIVKCLSDEEVVERAFELRIVPVA